MIGQVAQREFEKEKRDWEACYKRVKSPASEEKVVDWLFIEADGIFIHLQREDQKEFEIKNAIVYEGWKRLSQKDERYQLVGKRLYCEGQQEIPFWEGASLEWSRKWDLS